MRSQFDRARPRLTTGEEEPVRSNDVSCLPRPHHWTGSIYSRFSVVTIPSPRWLLGKYIRFLWRGNVCVAIMIKRGICTLCTRCVDPSLAGSTGLLSSRLPKFCRVFPRPLTDYYRPGHCIMVTLWRGRPMVTTVGMMIHQWHVTSLWVVITPPWCNIITLPPHSSHQHLTGQVSPRNIRQQFFRPLLSDKAGNYKMLSIFGHSQLRLLFLHLEDLDNITFHV